VRILDEAAIGLPVAPARNAVANGEPPQHVLRSPLEQGLAEAEARALAELDLIRSTLDRAMEAARTCRMAVAEEVVVSVRESERRYADVHNLLLGLIARQSPVAGHLRLAMALLHVNDRAERMAAQCMSIATLCSAMPHGSRPASEQLDCLSEMACLASEQLAEARRAFAERDVDAAARLREHDQAINEHNRRCFSLAIEGGEDEAGREAGFLAAMMARAIERIGDNAVGIGQQLTFAVTGRLRRSA
jgi:phosphate transport system protein